MRITRSNHALRKAYAIACAVVFGSFLSAVSAADAPSDNSKAEAWKRKLVAQFDGGNRWAILVGVNKYKQKPLHQPARTARLLAETLQKHCGYPASRILVITDEEMDAELHPTKKNLQSLNTAQMKFIQAGDTLLFYFCGHGMGHEGKSYLCPLDFESTKAVETAWRTDELRTLLQSCPASQKLLIIDSCHSGGQQSDAAATTSGSGEEVGAAFEQARGLMTLASCRKNETALGNNKYGIFSYLLARGLQGVADSDANGIVDSDELYRHLIVEVPIMANEQVPGHKQTPVRIIGEDVVGVFALSRTDGPVPEDDSRPPRPKIGTTIENSLGMKLTFIPPGVFEIGSPIDEFRRKSDEPQRQPISISMLLYLGTYEVTQAQYTAVMGKNPSYFSSNGGGSELVENLKTKKFPVDQVSWEEANEFCRKLSELPEEIAAGREYRLPTEAEWEYACRANSTTIFSMGDRLPYESANIRSDHPYLDSPEGPPLGRTCKVGSYKPNAFGLYDMHGNVAEWCGDWYSPESFHLTTRRSELEKVRSSITLESALASINPTGPARGETRVIRGGAYTGEVAHCRSAARRHYAPDYRYRANGFRVACISRKPVPAK